MMRSYAELHIQLARKTVHRPILVPRKMENLDLSLPGAHTLPPLSCCLTTLPHSRCPLSSSASAPLHSRLFLTFN
jgi:hypothetical protein